MPFYWLVLGILGVWQVTRLLHAEEGPFRVFERFRALLAGSFLGRAVACFDCLSMWVAVPFAVWIGGRWSEEALLWLALAAGASLLERATQGEDAPPATYSEDVAPPSLSAPAAPPTQGEDDVQVRQQEPEDGGSVSRQAGSRSGNG